MGPVDPDPDRQHCIETMLVLDGFFCIVAAGEEEVDSGGELRQRTTGVPVPQPVLRSPHPRGWHSSWGQARHS